MSALQDFHDGFGDGYNGRKRQTNRGGVYLRAYKSGAEARIRQDNGGEDMGDAPGSRPRLSKRAVAKVA